MGDLISDLDLDGRTGVRAQPGHPVFGTADVPSTAQKRLQRITAWTGFAAALLILLGLAMSLYMALQS